jgi:hypothetical protein
MDCPYCGRQLLAVNAEICPACGKSLPAPASIPLPPPVTRPFHVNWILFFAVLLAPPLLTLLVVQGGRKAEGAAVAVALLVGGAAGLACGIMLGLGLGKTSANKVLLSVVFAGALSVACVGMSCCGCLAGGFHLDFR